MGWTRNSKYGKRQGSSYCNEKKRGCEIILIGFESLDTDNLKQMNKAVNIMEAERDELVQRIHNTGIGIYATFVFGYDNDTQILSKGSRIFQEA